jgi:hypothetical protein
VGPRALALAVAATVGLAWSPTAAAHGTTIPHDLTGVTLCLDEASLHVEFDGTRGDLTRTLVQERLHRALVGTLDAAALPWRYEEVCPPDRGYVAVALEVRPADWFAPRASEYRLQVRVGWRSDVDGVVRAEPADAFDFAVTELFDERAVGVPAFVYLPGYVEAGVRDMAVSWWEDQQVAAPMPSWVPWLGGGLASLSACLTALALRRRWQRVRPPVRIIPHEGSHPGRRERAAGARLRAGRGARADAPLDRR